MDSLLGEVNVQLLQTAAERERFNVATTLVESIGINALVGGCGAGDDGLGDGFAGVDSNGGASN